MAAANSLRSVLYALVANFAVAVAKLTAAAITGSGAMLAEGIHSIADTGNQLLLILGLKRAGKRPTDAHPLGYGKSVYFWSFVVAILLFTMGGMFSLYEGWHKLHHPQPLHSPWIAIAVLAFAIVAEGFALAGCLREINKVRRGRSLWRWFRESRQAELLVVLGEDTAALVGLTLALAAVTLTLVTGNPLYDALGTLAIGALLIVIASLIAAEVRALLIGQSAEPHVVAEMEAFLDRQPEVSSLYNLVSLQMGGDVMVAAKARMSRASTPRELVTNINGVEERFRARFPEVVWLFFEPDIDD